MALEIRRAEAGDVAAVVELHRELHQVHLEQRPDQFKPTRDAEIASVDAAHAAGVTEIELNSWAFNHDAHAAFQSFGFVPKVVRFELKR